MTGLAHVGGLNMPGITRVTGRTKPQHLGVINTNDRTPYGRRMTGITNTTGTDVPCRDLMTIDTGTEHLCMVNDDGYPAVCGMARLAQVR